MWVIFTDLDGCDYHWWRCNRCGIARDCALRGINCILLERRDIATGATGRNHGLLHSGARYAVNDQESAEECIKENKILRNIARHCVDETEGLFITLPEDSLDYQNLHRKLYQIRY